MKKQRVKPGLLTATTAASLVLAAGISFAAHPPVPLYTFEEIGLQMGAAAMPVRVDAAGKGMPYSPKMTCGTADCHTAKNGVSLTYDHISDHSFHSSQGRNEFPDTATGKFDPTKNKPWTQATAMVGKW